MSCTCLVSVFVGDHCWLFMTPSRGSQEIEVVFSPQMCRIIHIFCTLLFFFFFLLLIMMVFRELLHFLSFLKFIIAQGSLVWLPHNLFHWSSTYGYLCCFQSLAVMVNFMCQFDWATRGQIFHSALFLVCLWRCSWMTLASASVGGVSTVPSPVWVGLIQPTDNLKTIRLSKKDAEIPIEFYIFPYSSICVSISLSVRLRAGTLVFCTWTQAQTGTIPLALLGLNSWAAMFHNYTSWFLIISPFLYFNRKYISIFT